MLYTALINELQQSQIKYLILQHLSTKRLNRFCFKHYSILDLLYLLLGWKFELSGSPNSLKKYYPTMEEKLKDQPIFTKLIIESLIWNRQNKWLRSNMIILPRLKGILNTSIYYEWIKILILNSLHQTLYYNIHYGFNGKRDIKGATLISTHISVLSTLIL